VSSLAVVGRLRPSLRAPFALPSRRGLYVGLASRTDLTPPAWWIGLHASAVRLSLKAGDGSPGASHEVWFPSALSGRAALGDTANIVRSRFGVASRSAAEEKVGRDSLAALAVLRLRKDARLFRRHTCATGTAGIAVARPSFPRRFAATFGSCAAGSFQTAAFRYPRAVVTRLGPATILIVRRTTLMGFHPSQCFILPAGVGALPPFLPTCRFAGASTSMILSRGRPSRAVFTHAESRRVSEFGCRPHLEGT